MHNQAQVTPWLSSHKLYIYRLTTHILEQVAAYKSAHGLKPALIINVSPHQNAKQGHCVSGLLPRGRDLEKKVTVMLENLSGNIDYIKNAQYRALSKPFSLRMIKGFLGFFTKEKRHFVTFSFP